GRVQETAAPIAESVPAEFQQVYHQPLLAIDGGGNPWIFFRIRTNLPRESKENDPFRALWRMEATTLRGGRWSPMMEFPQGYGRIDSTIAAIRKRDGNLAVLWTTDGRVWPSGRPQQQDLRFTTIPAGPSADKPALTAFTPSTENLPASHPNEAADVARRSAGIPGASCAATSIATPIFPGTAIVMARSTIPTATRSTPPPSTTWAYAITRRASPSRTTGGVYRRRPICTRFRTASRPSTPTSAA